MFNCRGSILVSRICVNEFPSSSNLVFFLQIQNLFSNSFNNFMVLLHFRKNIRDDGLAPGTVKRCWK